MCSNNVQNENLITDAEPTSDRDEHEPNVEENPQQESSPPKAKPKKKKRDSKTVNNTINIKNAQGIHIGPKYSISVSTSQKNENQKPQMEIPKHVSKLMRRNDPLTEAVITLVSTHIGENWRLVCRSLDYSNGQIYQFEEYYRLNGVKEIVNQILIDWKQNKPQESRVGTLVSALWYANERDIVERLVVKLSSS